MLNMEEQTASEHCYYKGENQFYQTVYVRVFNVWILQKLNEKKQNKLYCIKCKSSFCLWKLRNAMESEMSPSTQDVTNPKTSENI